MNMHKSKNWLKDLKKNLVHRQTVSMYRQLATSEHHGAKIVRQGCLLLNFSGNDYLALASHPKIKLAAQKAIEQHGVGSGASKLVTGHTHQTQDLERQFAKFKHAEAALLFPTGYMANLGVLTTLANEQDVICIDKLTHASLIDAAGASNATLRVYPHGHLEKLERLLDRHADFRRRFIVTDSVFSMDGDVANLPQICNLAQKYDAITVIDEAHGTGVLGASGAGLCEYQKIQDQADIVISTASKALGSLGGIVTAKKIVIDTLVNAARSLIYTTAPPPSQVASIAAALDVIQAEPWRRERLFEISKRVRNAVVKMGFELPHCEVVTPIIPLMTQSAESAVELGDYMNAHGIHAPAIRPPTVAPNASRVRLSLRCDLEDEQIENLIHVLKNCPQTA